MRTGACFFAVLVLGAQCSLGFLAHGLVPAREDGRVQVHMQACANVSSVRGEPWIVLPGGTPVLHPRPTNPYSFSRPVLTPQSSNSMLSLPSFSLRASNATLALEGNVKRLSKRVERLENLLEKVLYAFTNSDDMALLEREAVRTLIVDEGMGKERTARLVRTSLLAIMRAHYIPLPPSAPLRDPKSNETGK